MKRRVNPPETATPAMKVGGKPKEGGQPATGQIVRIIRGQNHGFIRTSDGREAFFHRADLSGKFIDLEPGDAVACELVEDRISGVRAVLVRKISK